MTNKSYESTDEERLLTRIDAVHNLCSCQDSERSETLDRWLSFVRLYMHHVFDELRGRQS